MDPLIFLVVPGLMIASTVALLVAFWRARFSGERLAGHAKSWWRVICDLFWGL